MDCYRFVAVDTADDYTYDQYHVDVRFTSNPSSAFQMAIYRGGACSSAECSGITDQYTWFTDCSPGGCGASPGTGNGEYPCTVADTNSSYQMCVNNGTTYFFCVSRPAGPSCNDYVIEASNGYY